ncbi:MAG: twin-arginine translocase subunit TatC [Alphaproteobacteria bacterium]|nr:twin-arginine translocase subunit TatC [Alphaproteobacteria bacterium]
MPLLDHLVELRKRLLYCIGFFVLAFLVSFHFAEHIFQFLIRPLAHVMEGRADARMIFTALHEAFFTYIKVAFFAAISLSFPMMASQVWMFVAPGLYRNERKAFLPFLVATPVMFIAGAALVYYFIFPAAWHFLLQFQTPGGEGTLPIQVEPKVDQYLSLSMQLIFAFGLAFEMPVGLLLMIRTGILSVDSLVRKRRYAIVLAFIVAAVLTPPDPLSQIGLAVPLIALYEISILIGRVIEKRRAEAEAAEGMAT